MPPSGLQREPTQVIDLCSDSEDEVDSDELNSGQDEQEEQSSSVAYNTDSEDESNDGYHDSNEYPQHDIRNVQPAPNQQHRAPPMPQELAQEWPLGEEWEAILAVPDIDFAPPSTNQERKPTSNAHEAQESLASGPFTEKDCLNQVLQLFPDIAHNHVFQLYREFGVNDDQGRDRCHRIIEKIIESTEPYPKEQDNRKELKRKREPSSEDDDFKEPEQVLVGSRQLYLRNAAKALADAFNEVPVEHIVKVLRQEKSLYRTYLVLDAQRHQEKKPFKALQKLRPNNLNAQSTSTDMNLLNELKLAKNKVAKESQRRKEQKRLEQVEEENEKQARASNSMSECGCCFTEYPLNRMIVCNGDVAHFFCYDCAKRLVESEIGNGKARPKCMDMSDCSATFARSELLKALRGNTKTLEKLEQLQQAEDIRLAGLDDLEGCPFCDFQAICPPIEIDREFRCENSECGKTSCRKCHLETHVPKSCEEFAKDNKMAHRHQVEEAMTAALTRECKKCKKKFLKESGCNKIVCPNCNNIQCYCCGEVIKNYEHFKGSVGPTLLEGKCPLYDNTEERHNKEVEEAEKAALLKLRAENPDLTEEDLRVKISDKVKEAEKKRIAAEQQRIQARDGGGVRPPPVMPLDLGVYYDELFGHLPAEARPAPPAPAPIPPQRVNRRPDPLAEERNRLVEVRNRVHRNLNEIRQAFPNNNFLRNNNNNRNNNLPQLPDPPPGRARNPYNFPQYLPAYPGYQMPPPVPQPVAPPGPPPALQPIPRPPPGPPAGLFPLPALPDRQIQPPQPIVFGGLPPHLRGGVAPEQDHFGDIWPGVRRRRTQQ